MGVLALFDTQTCFAGDSSYFARNSSNIAKIDQSSFCFDSGHLKDEPI